MDNKKRNRLFVVTLALALPVTMLTLWQGLQGEESHNRSVAPYRLRLLDSPDKEAEIAFLLKRIKRNPGGGLDQTAINEGLIFTNAFLNAFNSIPIGRSKKYCFRMFGSNVDPDLLATMTFVCARSRAASTAAI